MELAQKTVHLRTSPLWGACVPSSPPQEENLCLCAHPLEKSLLWGGPRLNCFSDSSL